MSQEPGDPAPPTPGRAMTIVVCALNEERWIRGTVEALVPIADDVLDTYDLILVDDGGTDRTGAIMDELASRLPRTRVVHNPAPRGLGWMFWEFVSESPYPHFMMLAGNGENSQESIRRLMTEAGSADLIVGYRTGHQRSLARWAISAGFQRTMSLALGVGHIKDWTGMFVWPVAAVRRLERMPPTNVYSVEVLLKLLEAGVSIKQVAAPQGPDRAMSKVVGWKTLRQTLALLWNEKGRRF